MHRVHPIPRHIADVFSEPAWLQIFLFVNPFHRLFSLDDLAIQYPHAEHERVPPGTKAPWTSFDRDSAKAQLGWLLAYAGGVPLLVLTIWAIIFRPAGHKARVTYLGLLLRFVARVQMFSLVGEKGPFLTS